MTMSPPANTPFLLVFPVSWSARMFPHLFVSSPGVVEGTSGLAPFPMETMTVSTGSLNSEPFMGTGRRLREADPEIRLVSVQPDASLHDLKNLKHMTTAIVPNIYDPSLADEDIGVSTEDAFALTRQLARTGLFVGISSGANLVAALNVAKRSPDAVIVVIFPDGGEKYLSERFWDEAGADASGSPA